MKVVSLENLNGFIVNKTINMIANEMGAKAAEEKPRLVRLVLRNSAEPKIPTDSTVRLWWLSLTLRPVPFSWLTVATSPLRPT